VIRGSSSSAIHFLLLSALVARTAVLFKPHTGQTFSTFCHYNVIYFYDYVQPIHTSWFIDEKREIEVEIVTSQDGQTTPNALNKWLILQHTVEVGGYPMSICSYQGKVYVASSTGLDVVVKHKLLSEKLISSSHLYADSVAAHRDRLYISNSINSLVTVYNLRGEKLFDWTHNRSRSNLVVVGNKIVVADTQNQILSVYSLTGEAITQLHVPISQGYGTTILICVIDNSSVVVSDYKTAKVFKVNISSGEVEWTSEHVGNPQGVAYHRGRVLVADRGARMTISVLDVETGNTNR